MSYIKSERRNELLSKQDNYLTTNRDMMNRKPEAVLFYEFEPAIVLDVILDENHPEIKSKTLDADDAPKNIDGSAPTFSDMDLSWVGRVKVRMVYSQRETERDLLTWAIPLENTGTTEYPLINEVVSVVRYFNNYYYTRKINIKGMVNANADISLERFYGSESTPLVTGADVPNSVMNATGTPKDAYVGPVGHYFKFNSNVRSLLRYEGDTVFESRFGSSIRIGAYDGNRKNDSGLGEYSDHGGNPMFLIRNRQQPVKSIGGNPAKLNKGYVLEDINKDGSSVHITSGKTITKFVPTTTKVMFQSSKLDEQSNFTPPKKTAFTIPELSGDQIVINSDRLIFSSKAAETFHYAKKQYAIVTDGEYSVDAAKQMMATTEDTYRVDAHGMMVLTTNVTATINAPKIYLGEHNQENEPVLLGRTTALWLYTLCNFMINNIDIQINLAQCQRSHSHISDSGTTGTTEQVAADQITEYVDALVEQRKHLEELRDSLPSTMSKRVFTVGGGGAPGHDGK